MATRTTEPRDLRALWVAFVAVFVRALLGGIVGDINHGASGYHIGGLFVNDDYSVQDRARDRPRFRVDPAARGIDLTLPPDLMRLFTGRIIAALRARDPRVFFIREINGTFNGRTTVNYDVLLGGQNYQPDDGHLFHIHLGLFRIYTLTAAQILGFIEVCAGLAAGTLTPAGASGDLLDNETVQEDDMAIFIVLDARDGKAYVGDTITRRWIPDEATRDDILSSLAEAGTKNPHTGKTYSKADAGGLRRVANPGAFGVLVGTVGAPAPAAAPSATK